MSSTLLCQIWLISHILRRGVLSFSKQPLVSSIAAFVTCLTIFTLSLPLLAAAQINNQVNYQARLMDVSGSPVADGSYNLKFSLYDAASDGNRVWTAAGTLVLPSAVSVSVQNGLLTVLLGSAGQNSLDTVDWDRADLYLGVTVATDDEMTPRKRLAAVPQAFNSRQLQGMYASSTAFGETALFTINQTSNTAATGTRTALMVRSAGTSSDNDFLIRGINDLEATVFSLNRQGSVTSTGLFAVTGSGTSTFTGAVSSTYGEFSTSLTVGGQTVCLADGTDCQAYLLAESDTLTDVSARGASATSTLSLYGGFLASSSTVTSTFTVLGDTSLKALTATRVTSTVGIDALFTANSTAESSVTISGFSAPQKFDVQGNLMVVPDSGTNDIDFVDVSDPGNPVTIKTITLAANQGLSAQIVGRYTYVAAQGAGSQKFIVIDHQAINGPAIVGALNFTSAPVDLFVSGRYAYVTIFDSNILQIIDISDPSAPQIVKSLTGFNNPWGVYVYGQYAYVANYGGSSLAIVDVSEPTQASITATYPLLAVPYYVAVQGNYAYVSYSDTGRLAVLDISNPQTPNVVTDVGPIDMPSTVAVNGRYAYVTAQGDNKVQVVDINNPAFPNILFSIDVGGIPTQAKPYGRSLYVSNVTDGTIRIYNLNGIETSGLVAHTAKVGELQVLTNGSIANQLSIGGGVNIGAGGIWSAGSLSIAAATSSFIGGLTVGSSTYSGAPLHSLFSMSGDDLFVAGNIGSVSSVYSNGAFVVGTGSTYYGDGYITKTDGNLTLQTSGGFILPNSDLGQTLGSDTLRFNAVFGDTTSTNATTTSLYVSGIASTAALYVNGQAVCLADGTNCAAAVEADTLFTVTDRGSEATSTLQLYGGFLASSSTVTSTFTVLGETNLQSVTATALDVTGTATSTFAGAVSSTRFVASDGSAATPAFSFTGNSNLGMYRVGNTIRFGDPDVATYFDFAADNLSYRNLNPGTDNVRSLGSSSLRWLNGWFTGTVTSTNFVATTDVVVNGQSVCLEDGTNCQAASGGTDLNWTFDGLSDFAHNATATTDLVLGSAATSTGAATYFDLSGGTNGTSTVYFGFNTNTNIVLGGTSTTETGLNSLFVMNGDDMFVKGNIGSASSIYTNGAFVAGSGSTYFGNGYIYKNDAEALRLSSVSGTLIDTSLKLSYTQTSPMSVTSTVTVNTSPQYIKVQGSYAYIINSGNPKTMSIVDISNPGSPSTTATVWTGAGANVWADFDVYGNYAYVVNYQNTDINIIDISKPDAPVMVATTTDLAANNGIRVNGNYAYVPEFGTSGLAVLDVSDPRKPTVVSRVGGMSSIWRVAAQGNYVYAISSDDNPTFWVIDVADPKNPRLVGTRTTSVSLGGYYDRLQVEGSYAYIGGSDGNGLTIIDISNPLLPKIMYSGAITGGPSTIDSMEDISINGRYLYVMENANPAELHVIDVLNRSNPQHVRSFNTGLSSGLGLDVSGNYVYAVHPTTHKLSVIDIGGVEATSLLAHSAELGQVNITGEAIVQNTLSVGSGLFVGVGGVQSYGALSVFATNTTSTFRGAVSTTQLFVNGQAVCLANGTNCGPATEADTLFTVTDRGSEATSTLSLYGGFLASSSTVTSTLSIRVAAPTVEVDPWSDGLLFYTEDSTKGLMISRYLSLPGEQLNTTLSFSDNPLNPLSASGTVMLYNHDVNRFDIRLNGDDGAEGTEEKAGIKLYNLDRVGVDGNAGVTLRNTSVASSTAILYLENNSGGIQQHVGSGSPEGSVYAVGGSIYYRRDGAAGTQAYLNRSGGADSWYGIATTDMFASRAGDFLPSADLTYSLGSASYRWNAELGNVTSSNVTTTNLYVSGIASTTALYVNGQSVCLADGTNCAAASLPDTLESTTASSSLFLSQPFRTPVVVATHTTAGSISDVYVSGNFVYASEDAYAQFSIIDVADPLSPSSTVRKSTGGGGMGTMRVVGDYAYVASQSSDQFQIYNIRNKKTPVLMGTAAEGGEDIEIQGSFAYLLDTDEFTIVDISNPSSPRITANIATSTGDRVHVYGRYAYLARGSNGLSILDISDPTNPYLVGQINPPGGYARDVVVSGRYAYLAAYSGGLIIYDIGNPASPILLDAYTANYMVRLFLAGNYIYAVEDSNLVIYDVSTKSDIKKLVTLNPPGTVLDVFVSGRYAYLAAGPMLVVDLFGLDTPTANIGSLYSQFVNITDNAYIGNNLQVNAGLIVGHGGILSLGSLGVSATNTTSTFMGAVSTTQLFVNSQSVCLANGTNCPAASESDTLATVSARGASATSTLQLYGGFLASSSTVTSTFTVLGASSFQSVTATVLDVTGAGTSTFSNGLSAPFVSSTRVTANEFWAGGSGTIRWQSYPATAQFSLTQGGIHWIRVAAGSGAMELYNGQVTTDFTTYTDGAYNLGTATKRFKNGWFTGTVTSTLLDAGTVSTSQILVGGQAVCLADGTNCADEADTLASVTDRGAFATSTLNLYGGFIASSSTVTSTLTITAAVPEAVTFSDGLLFNSVDTQKGLLISRIDAGQLYTSLSFSDNPRSALTTSGTLVLYNHDNNSMVMQLQGNGGTEKAKLLFNNLDRVGGSDSAAAFELNVASTASSSAVVKLSGDTGSIVQYVGGGDPTGAVYTPYNGSVYFRGYTDQGTQMYVHANGWKGLATADMFDGLQRDFLPSGDLTRSLGSTSLRWNATLGAATATTLMVGSNASATGTLDYSMVITYASNNGGLCIDDTLSSETCPFGNGSSILADGAVTANAFDLAEVYAVSGTSTPGDLLVFDQAASTTVKVSPGIGYDPGIIGVVSTRPGFLLGWNAGTQVTLAGRVPLKVIPGNGPIAIGDALTSSNVAGHAMKATKPGMVVGYALENATATGTIEAFIAVGYWAGDVLTTDGTTSQLMDNLVITATSTASSTNQNVDSWGLTFRGSAWNSELSTIADHGFTLKNDIVNATSSRFVLENTNGSTTVSVTQSGDLSISGRLYPSARGRIQNQWYMFVDDSFSPTSTYMATNADGWQAGSSYDLAEMYYSPDRLEAGDVVMVAPNGRLRVQRTLNETNRVMGIVSSKPGFLLGKHGTSTYPIALAGRVPTKVSTINGSIVAGDALAPSSIPGVAVKATRTGPTIGLALEDYSDSTIGKIEVFVQSSWYTGGEQLAADGEQQVISDEAEVTSNEIVYRGTARIAAGSRQVRVTFPGSLNAYPMVQVTPRGIPVGNWGTDLYSDLGFMILLTDMQENDLYFTWEARPLGPTLIHNSDGTVGQLDSMTGQFVGDPVAPTSTETVAEVIPDPAPAPDPAPDPEPQPPDQPTDTVEPVVEEPIPPSETAEPVVEEVSITTPTPSPEGTVDPGPEDQPTSPPDG